jgi:hypothetical protein
MPSTPIALGNPIYLSLTLSDGATGMFPRAFIYNSADVLVVTRNLIEVGATGRYTDSGYTPVVADLYTAQFITYRDALFTIESRKNGRVEEAYSVTTLLADVTQILADTTAIIAQNVLILADTGAIIVLATDISELQRSEVRVVPQGSALGGPPREDRLNAAAVVIATALAFEDEQATIPYRDQGMNNRKRLT